MDRSSRHHISRRDTGSKPNAPSVLFIAAVGATLEGFVAPVSRALEPYQMRRVAVAGRGSIPPSLHESFDAIYEITPLRRESLGNIARAGRDLVRIVRNERPHLLHLHSPYAIALGRLVARSTGTPHVAVVHGTFFGDPGKTGRLFTAVETASAWLTPTYITINPDDQASYRRLAPRSKVHLAPCGGAGIDLQRLMTRGSGERAGGGRPPRALVLGRLTPDKNLDLAVDAWRLARQAVPDLELRIVGSTAIGEPPWFPPNEPGISTAGWSANPGAELAAADVLLSTSLWEGFGMVLAEALMSSTPVVAVDNRGSRAVAEQVREGLALVPPRAAAMASALLSQLRAQTVRLRPEALKSWQQDSVVSYHASEIVNVIKATGWRPPEVCASPNTAAGGALELERAH